jgi:hypothetical protein
MSLGDSILQTASIARCVSVAVTDIDQTIFNRPVQGKPPSANGR